MIKKKLQKIFKIISYGIYFKIYGKINESIHCNENKKIEIKTVNIAKNLIYRVYNIKNGRLYTDRIHDLAAIIENKIIAEPSFQLRFKGPFIYNANIEENIVFKKGTPRKLKKLNGSVLSLLTGGAGNSNYFHWLFDVLPRLLLCDKTKNLKNIDYFLLPDHIKKFQTETLDCLNIPKHKRLSSEKFRHIKAKELIITDHPVVTSKDPTKDIMNKPIWISEWLKDSFLKKINKINDKKTKKIFIDRDDTNSNLPSKRFITNESEIKECLVRNNFISVKLQELKFIEQVQLFFNADCIVGLHGGGFANIVFCKPKTKIIEFRGINSGKVLQDLAEKNNLNYSPITVEAKQNLPNQQGGIHVPIDDLNMLIENFDSHPNRNE